MIPHKGSFKGEMGEATFDSSTNYQLSILCLSASISHLALNYIFI